MPDRREGCPFQGAEQPAVSPNIDFGMVDPGKLKTCSVCGVVYYEGEIPDCMKKENDE